MVEFRKAVDVECGRRCCAGLTKSVTTALFYFAGQRLSRAWEQTSVWERQVLVYGKYVVLLE